MTSLVVQRTKKLDDSSQGVLGNSGVNPGGVLGISSDGDDRMEPIVKTQKNP